MPGKTGHGSHADKALVAKRFSKMRVGKVDFEDWHCDRFNRIEDRDRRVRIASGVEEHGFGADGVCFMQPVDQVPLMVRLAHINCQTQLARLILEPPGNLVERVVPIDFWLADAEQVEVGAVQDKDYRRHGVAIGRPSRSDQCRFDLSQPVLAKKHLAADEEGRDAKGAPCDCGLGIDDKRVLD